MTAITFSSKLLLVILGGGFITNNVERFRNEHNLTQKELAEKLNVTQGTISMIENGDRNPSVDLLLRMASVFNISVDQLIGKPGDVRDLNEKEAV